MSPSPTPEPARIVVRCDADERIGLGHAARALAVADSLAERLGVVPLLIARDSALLDRFLGGRAVRRIRAVEPGYASDTVLGTLGAGAVLVSDTYELTEEALDRVAASGACHVVVDDFATLARWPCDVVVNPNIGSGALLYAGARHVLTGSSHALVRREIVSRRGDVEVPRPEVRRVIATFSGADWGGAARELLERLAEVVGRAVEVRVASREPYPDPLEAVPPETLPDQLAWADLGLIGGGVTKYEAACLGLPTLLVAFAPHQAAVAVAFAETGAARYLGELGGSTPQDVVDAVAALVGDPESVRRISNSAFALVDGLGAERVADAALSLARRAKRG